VLVRVKRAENIKQEEMRKNFHLKCIRRSLIPSESNRDIKKIKIQKRNDSPEDILVLIIGFARRGIDGLENLSDDFVSGKIAKKSWEGEEMMEMYCDGEMDLRFDGTTAHFAY
jgi:hypothetical protein